MKNILELLKGFTQQLVKTRFRSLDLALDRNSVEKTLDELQSVASQIASIKHSSSLLAGLHWNISKSKTEKLTDELRRRRADLLDVVALINRLVQTQGKGKSDTRW